MGAEDLVANGHNVVVVEYHLTDVFETTSAMARQSFYWVTALPTVQFDGVIEMVGGNNTTTMYETYLPLYEERAAIMSDFSLSIEGANSQLTEYVVDVIVEKVAENSSSNLALMFALTETEIDYYWMGQEYVNYCERFMLPDADGTDLDFTNGDILEFSFSFTLDPDWIQEKCELAVWVQDMTTKEVQQAAKRSLDEFGDFPERDAAVVNIYSPITLCNSMIEPAIEVENLGTSNLTSLDIIYKVNNEPEQTFSWTGDIPYLSSDVVELPVIELAGITAGVLNISLENPNGSSDQYPYNDTMSFVFDEAANVSSPVTLVLKLDDFPEQTSWELLTSGNEVLYSGDNYDEPGIFVTEVFDLVETDCYTFNIYDSEGDGLTGTGLYKLMYGTTIFQTGKDFGQKDEVEFGIGLTGESKNHWEPVISIFPNPATEFLTVKTTENCNVKLQNLSGKVVLSGLISTNFNSLNVSSLTPGIYLMVLEGNWGISTRKIVIL